MLRILDRYVIRETIPPFALSLLVLTFVLMIPPIMDVAEGLIAKGVPLLTVAQIMGTLVPQGLGITIPMALLIGLLIGLGRMSADREVVALQACGVGLRRLLWPVGLLAAGAFGATLYTLVVALPDANQSFREITYRIVAERAEQEVRPRVFYEDFPGIVLYVRDTPADGVGWRKVFLADMRRGESPEVFLADRGWMLVDRARRRVDVLLEHGTRHQVDPAAPGDYTAQRFDRLFITLDPETVFPRSGPQRGYPELRLGELRAEVERLRRAGLSPHRPIMEIHKKFSIPTACLVFAVIALALGVTSRKDGKLAGFALGVGVIFAYYVVMYGAEAMAKGGLVSPHLAMWLPNVILGALGVTLLVRKARSVERRVDLARFAFLSAWLAERLGRPPRDRAPARPLVVVRVPRWRLPRPSTLDTYVTSLYLNVMGLAFLGLLGVFYISTFIDLSDKLWKGQTTTATLFEYFWYATPQFIYYVVPLSTLVAALVAVGVLTKRSELTVMKACGISLYRVALPLVLCGAFWSLFLFGLSETVLPRANRRAEQIRHIIRGGSPQTFEVLNRKWVVGRRGNIYHYLYLDPRQRELHGLSIYEFDPVTWQLVERTFVTRARYSNGWLAGPGWTRRFDPGDSQRGFTRFEHQRLDLEPPDYFVTEQPDAERMNYRQLARYIQELEASGFQVVQLAVALYRKVSFPLVTVIMTLLAIPFAVTTGSRGTLYGIGVGIVLALTYWVIFSISAAVGSAGLLAPLLAAWTPNLLFGAAAAYLLLTVRT